MITFRVGGMKFEYHSPNIVPFPEFVIDAFESINIRYWEGIEYERETL